MTIKPPALHKVDQLAAVPGQTYGELVRAVIRMSSGDVSSDQAEAIVDAVLGPLKLVPPRSADLDYNDCKWAYFDYDGVWHFCRRDHTAEPDEPEWHISTGGLDWEDEDFRVVPPEYT